ncbi:MAG: hypothetical protein ABR987_03080 [Terracidiphilus sp.]
MPSPLSSKSSCAHWKARQFSGFCAAVIASSLILLASGCTTLRAGKHPDTFATAANLVVENATNAYQGAIDLHDREQVSNGVLKVEADEEWSYNQMKPLIAPEGLKTRTKILDGLKLYAKSISDAAASVDSPALSSAAKSTAGDLKDLGSTIDTDAGGSKTGLALSTEMANGAATAMLALGESLAAKKVNAALPAITTQMDPHIATLCDVLTSDIAVLRRQTKKDYDDLARQQWAFITINKAKLSPLELRDEIDKLPSYRKDEQSADDKLGALDDAIKKLKMAHHDLMDAANSKDPEALKDKLTDFETAGDNLGNFYQSLSAKSSSGDKSGSGKSSSDKSTDTDKKE